MTDHRNPLTKARDAWLESEEGKQCAAGSTEGQYLRNRLERAFIAGYEAGQTEQPVARKKTRKG